MINLTSCFQRLPLKEKEEMLFRLASMRTLSAIQARRWRDSPALTGAVERLAGDP